MNVMTKEMGGGTMQEIHKTPGSRKIEIPISEKYMLTINEAAVYFSIGVKKYCLMGTPLSSWSLFWNCCRQN